MAKVSVPANPPTLNACLKADAAEDYPAATEQYNSGNGHNVQSESEGLAYEQILPSFGLPPLTDLDMTQFPRAELLGHSFGEFSLGLDQLNSTY